MYEAHCVTIVITTSLPLADLLKALSLWLPESKHKQLAAMWPPSSQESD